MNQTFNYPGISVPFTVPTGFEITYAGLHNTIRDAALFKEGFKLFYFSGILQTWKEDTNPELSVQRPVDLPAFNKSILLKPVATAAVAANSIEIPEFPGFKILAIGIHEKLRKLADTNPEYAEAKYAFLGRGKQWNHHVKDWVKYGETDIRVGPDDLTILLIPENQTTLGEIADGQIFTCEERLLDQPAGQKFQRYYDHLVVLGQPGDCGATDFFKNQSYSTNKTKVKIVV